jgi:deoxyribose-phosphate aldolase
MTTERRDETEGGRRAAAARALACLDLTSLNDDDTAERIDKLIGRARSPGTGIDGHPAALCVYPRFVAQVSRGVDGTPIKVAAVANFPLGTASVGAVIDEVESALLDGADEIDVVLPFRQYLAGDADGATHLVRMVSRVCNDREEPALLKVILETGVLRDRAAIAAAALDAIDAGADFVKTSTGKLEPGATPDAVEALLEVIADVRQRDGRQIGLKVSGGVRTVDDAASYLALADDYLTPDEANPANFRFGASGLLDDIVRVLTGVVETVPLHNPSNY